MKKIINACLMGLGMLLGAATLADTALLAGDCNRLLSKLPLLAKFALFEDKPMSFCFPYNYPLGFSKRRPYRFILYGFSRFKISTLRK